MKHKPISAITECAPFHNSNPSKDNGLAHGPNYGKSTPIFRNSEHSVSDCKQTTWNYGPKPLPLTGEEGVRFPKCAHTPSPEAIGGTARDAKTGTDCPIGVPSKPSPEGDPNTPKTLDPRPQKTKNPKRGEIEHIGDILRRMGYLPQDHTRN